VSEPSEQVLYRKWRPKSFAEVVGQDAVTRTLRNSVAAGRLAHAYLLCGPRGTGKTTLGRLLAKAANCDSATDGEPCNRCESCRAFNEGRAMDFIEQDAASHNSVDDIRQLRENVILTPMSSARKIYLLDEVHMLSNAAENALLKTLEEPPPHIVFVLATTDPHKVASTIISRCQRFDLKRIPLQAAVERMAEICSREGFTLERDAIEEIARATTGSLRDGINALEQVVTYYGKSPTLEQVQEALGLRVDVRSGRLALLALEGDLAGGLRLISEVKDDGVDIKQFAVQVVKYLRGLLLAKAGVTEALDLPQGMAAEVRAEATRMTREEILRALQTFGRIDWHDEASMAGPLPLELALMEFTSVVTEAPRPAVASVAAAAPPVRRTEAAPPPPRKEPEFSMPAVELGAMESTITTATVRPPEPAAPVTTEEAPAGAKRTVPSGQHSGDLLEKVRSTLREQEADKNLQALLNGSCEVRAVEADSVTLGFYHTFHLERVEQSSFGGTLSAAFSSALGHSVTVRFEHAPRERPEGSAERKGGHLVQAARELGAQTVQKDD